MSATNGAAADADANGVDDDDAVDVGGCGGTTAVAAAAITGDASFRPAAVLVSPPISVSESIERIEIESCEVRLGFLNMLSESRASCPRWLSTTTVSDVADCPLAVVAGATFTIGAAATGAGELGAIKTVDTSTPAGAFEDSSSLLVMNSPPIGLSLRDGGCEPSCAALGGGLADDADEALLEENRLLG
uniref:Uncharacterized protein n=1 Tax=Anopheles merus TaxID=30066 RepID=A0A182VMZ2_ANOME